MTKFKKHKKHSKQTVSFWQTLRIEKPPDILNYILFYSHILACCLCCGRYTSIAIDLPRSKANSRKEKSIISVSWVPSQIYREPVQKREPVKFKTVETNILQCDSKRSRIHTTEDSRYEHFILWREQSKLLGK